jgi:hypothetical protein
MVGIVLRHGTFGAKDRNGGSSFSQLFIMATKERFLLKKFFKWVAYQKVKIEDGIDIEVHVNLGFVNFTSRYCHNPQI